MRREQRERLVIRVQQAPVIRDRLVLRVRLVIPVPQDILELERQDRLELEGLGQLEMEGLDRPDILE